MVKMEPPLIQTHLHATGSQPPIAGQIRTEYHFIFLLHPESAFKPISCKWFQIHGLSFAKPSKMHPAHIS
uniref:HL01681p n=1 Tax=Drosophila melanogaster TaxID=7227 RepID=Q5BHZ8_DROME|nr:HL01681p [Drosophila melanogaster]